MKIGILGFGKMGEAIALGLLRGEHSRQLGLLTVSRTEENAKDIAKRFEIPCYTSNKELVSNSDIVLLCVKPHQAQSVLEEVASELRPSHLLISICASVTTRQLQEWGKGKAAVIRAMPNTPSLIGKGMTVYCAGPGVSGAQRAIASQIFETLGKVALIEESLMDGATGLSGCGPAYVYLIIEALSEAGVKVGLSRNVATLLAAQTLAGSAEMLLERGVHPAALKDEVTTPAGCTIDGLMALEEGKLRVTLIKAVVSAAERSKSLRNSSQENKG